MNICKSNIANLKAAKSAYVKLNKILERSKTVRILEGLFFYHDKWELISANVCCNYKELMFQNRHMWSVQNIANLTFNLRKYDQSGKTQHCVAVDPSAVIIFFNIIELSSMYTVYT